MRYSRILVIPVVAGTLLLTAPFGVVASNSEQPYTSKRTIMLQDSSQRGGNEPLRPGYDRLKEAAPASVPVPDSELPASRRKTIMLQDDLQLDRNDPLQPGLDQLKRDAALIPESKVEEVDRNLERNLKDQPPMTTDPAVPEYMRLN